MSKSKLALAISITAQAFVDKVDRGGHPYILHCLRVMNAVSHLGEDAMCAAVMHDLIEDCPGWSIIRLEKFGFSETTLNAVAVLTKTEFQDYPNYINRVSFEKIPRAIKIADLEDNLIVYRTAMIKGINVGLLNKYIDAYRVLKSGQYE